MTAANDTQFLRQAIELASESEEFVGRGSVTINNQGEVLAATSNSQRTDQQAVNHAEIKAIQAANTKTGSRKLIGATAYCSCEPCAMCIAAMSYAKIERIVFVKTMQETFPDDTQGYFDSHAFIETLNFKPKLEQINLH